MGSWVRGLAVTLLLALSAYQGVQLHRLQEKLESLSELPPVPPFPPGAGQSAAVAACPPRLSEADIAAIARAVEQHPTNRAGDPAPPAEPPPPSRDEARLVAEATEIVRRSLAVGVMTRDDGRALRRLRSQLGPSPELDALRQQLVLAVNAQKLRPEDPIFFLP